SGDFVSPDDPTMAVNMHEENKFMLWMYALLRIKWFLLSIYHSNFFCHATRSTIHGSSSVVLDLEDDVLGETEVDIKQVTKPLIPEHGSVNPSDVALGYHDNIVGYTTCWFEDNKLYMQMELCARILSFNVSSRPFAEGDLLEAMHQDLAAVVTVYV
ncbi:hypothetical protein Tco_1513778, partial [Tanacetum coccineum]